MSNMSAHAEVWVIDQGKACLLRQGLTGLLAWQLERSMPLDEFLGSAVALSSFTQADTRVFYNLEPIGKSTCEKRLTQHTGQHWLGIEEDPLRLVEAAATAHVQQELHALQAMGKKVQVICCAEPALFERGTPMMRVNTREKNHLAHWLAKRKQGVGPQQAGLGLFNNLLINPESAYQVLRIVALGCTVFALTASHHLNDHQLTRQADNLSRHAQQTLRNTANTIPTIHWPEWGIQLGKFGKDKRANLNSVSIHWNEDGHVDTQVSLNRERKRVPKGCTLETPRSASCKTQGVAR